MIRKLTTLFAAAAVLGGLGTTMTLFAEENAPSANPAAQGRMGDHRGMMTMMGQMTPDHMQQMSRMIDNCSRMMESMGDIPRGHDQERAPDHNG